MKRGAINLYSTSFFISNLQQQKYKYQVLVSLPIYYDIYSIYF